MKGLLFDRIINVTFYREAQSVEVPYKLCNPDIFRKETRNKKTVLSAQDTNSVIEFHKGRSYDLFVDYDANHNARYKRRYAHGPVYVVRTIEDMKRGTTPQGNPFQSGSLVRVTEDNSLWNVYVSGAVDSFYTESTYEVPKAELTIEIPDYGKKPSISLDISLIPGQNCYGAVLRIANLNLNPFELRTWNRMRIVAGYNQGDKAIFDCPIFASYIETPNPDGITVFEGLTIGAVDSVLLDKYMIIDFIQDQMSITEFIKSMMKAIGDNITPNIALGKYADANKYKINITRQKVYARNGAAVLNWLQNFISDYVKEASGQVDDVFVQLHDGILDVILLTGETGEIDTTSVINLDMVTGASFSGTALTVIAPWNPKLLPGQLFFMPPYFFNGHTLPNSINPSAYRTPQNLYRVITMSVNFATAENTNKMTILAMPAYSTHEDDGVPPEEMTADSYARREAQIYKPGEHLITVGEIHTEYLPLVEDPSVLTKTGVPFIDDNSDILGKWSDWVSVSQSEYTGSNIPDLVNYYMWQMLGGPRLPSKNYPWPYKMTRLQLQDQHNTMGLKYYKSSGVSAISIWWPLAALGTYWKRQQDITQQKSNNWSNIRADNIQYVEDGTAILMPVFTSWQMMRSALVTIRDIWKQAYLDYQNVNTGIRSDWKTMYYYLGGTDEF